MITKEEIIQICRESLDVENLTNSGTDTDKYSFKLYFETVADKISSRLDALVILQLAEEITTVLSNCKTKLQLYRANMDGEYLGGVEYTELIKRIDDLFSKLSK
uniref:Uncharacterized protein n=1 Tax=viral metagenome TaxID=1070528 RepID=A0A6M3LUC0_9ZZZZ